MDFTNIKCISEQSKKNDVRIHGAGASWGGRVEYSCVKCPECGLKLLLMPVKDDYTYSISARTEKEEEERRQQEKELRELEERAEELRRKLS